MQARVSRTYNSCDKMDQTAMFAFIISWCMLAVRLHKDRRWTKKKALIDSMCSSYTQARPGTVGTSTAASKGAQLLLFQHIPKVEIEALEQAVATAGKSGL